MFRKNVAGQFCHFQGVDAATGGIKSGVTWTVRRCIDGTFASATGTVTEDSANGWYKFAMSQADTNGNNIGFNFTGTGAIPQTVNIITTAADPTDAVRLGLTALPNAAAEAAGGLYTRGTGAGQINQPANGQVDANAVKLGGTTVTGRDIGASVLLSSGTGTGQIDFTSGVVKANLAQILGTALTETSGQIAAAFKKFFDKASPTGTVNSLPDAVPDASGGLPVTGTRLTAIPTLPAALIGGRMDASVGAYQSGQAPLQPTTAGRTLDVSASGEAGVDWANVGSPTSTVSLSGTTVGTTTALTNAPSDSSGVTTLLSRLSALRAGYLDNLSAGAAALESSLQSLITTIGAAGAGLTATASAVWSVTTRLLTAGTNIVLTKGTSILGFNDLSAAAVNAEVDTALADYDGPTHTELTAELATADDAVLAVIGTPAGVSVSADIAAVKGDTTGIPSVSDIASEVADRVWDEAASSHVSSGTTGAALSDLAYAKGYRAGNTSNIIRFVGGTIGQADQGQAVVTPLSPFIVSYDNQYVGRLFVISDVSNTLMEFEAAVVSSDTGANSLTLSKALPSLGSIDPIPFLIIPAGMGDATRALVLYEGD